MSVTKVARSASVTASAIYCVYGTNKCMREGDVRAAAWTVVSGSDRARTPMGFAQVAREDARRVAHECEAVVIIQSWSPDELDVNNPDDVDKAHAAGLFLAEALAPDCDVLVATHTDAKGRHLHNHIVISNYERSTGKAITYQDAGFHPAVKKANDALMRDMGLQVLEPSRDRSPRPSPGVPALDWHEEVKEAVARLMSDPRVLGAVDVDAALESMKDCAEDYGLSMRRRRKSGKRSNDKATSFALVDKDGNIRKVQSGNRTIEAKIRGSRLGDAYTTDGLKETLAERMAFYRRQQAEEALAERLITDLETGTEELEDGLERASSGGDDTAQVNAVDDSERGAHQAGEGAGSDDQAATGAGEGLAGGAGRGEAGEVELASLDTAGVEGAEQRLRDALARLDQRRRADAARRRAAADAAKADERKRQAREQAEARQRRWEAIADDLVANIEGYEEGEYGLGS